MAITLADAEGRNPSPPPPVAAASSPPPLAIGDSGAGGVPASVGGKPLSGSSSSSGGTSAVAAAVGGAVGGKWGTVVAEYELGSNAEQPGSQPPRWVPGCGVVGPWQSLWNHLQQHECRWHEVALCGLATTLASGPISHGCCCLPLQHRRDPPGLSSGCAFCGATTKA